MESTIKPGKIFAIDRKRIIKIIGRLNILKTKKVIEKLNLDINIEE